MTRTKIPTYDITVDQATTTIIPHTGVYGIWGMFNRILTYYEGTMSKGTVFTLSSQALYRVKLLKLGEKQK